MNHECTSNCRRNGCPLCPHGKDDETECDFCDKVTYKCNFEPSESNGHWHTSQAEADRCITSWERFNTAHSRASEKPKWTGYGFIPKPDIDNRSFIN